MGLSASLGTAISGLHATQVGIGVVSQNVANADKPGYIRRTVSTSDTLSGLTVSTGNTNVQRLLDQIVQRQLWQESAGAAYTSTRAGVLSNLDQLYGAPGSTTALDSVYSSFTSSLQALRNDPSSYTNRSAVIDSAALLAGRLNGLSDGVQALRTQAESGIATAVTQVNELLNSLTSVNARIVGSPNDNATADLKDRRDQIVAELSQYIDIKTSEDARGSLTVVTGSGAQIFDGRPSVTFKFDERSGLSPESQWNADPALRGVGTITVTDGSGNTVDAIANNTFRSGAIAAYVELRDKTLVRAQAQLDEIAAQMSSALSDREVAGTVTTAAPASQAALTYNPADPSTVNLSTLARGNSVTFDYKATPGNTTQRFTFVNVAGGTSLPASAQGDANNRVVGIDFSAAPATVQAQMQAAVGGSFTVAYDGTTLSIADDGAAGAYDVVGLTARPTATGLTGSAELPFFVDGGRGNAVFTGSYENGSQTTGYAGRIVVDPRLIADRSKLAVYDTGVPQGDTTRPNLLLQRLSQSQRSFTRSVGLDGATASTTGTVSNFVQRVVASTGQAVETAKRLDEGQQVALAAVQSRFQDTSQVNIDQEMSTLIELQTAYAANARVISTVKELMDVLLRV
ncbi:flagellar hook-associated protein FlgK [Bosea sp. PAMC 26642]|uniref:flagellar hook-associated protein FlgK n=1 Tax=Bosea sp. (strain PAMC 26642) TaxID=1792307 RepID=UPI0007700106|nr:flagellar hook-associated protein FlgK [Bosea sp. PAMC 26642]AMJ60542.1 hypothetical protein AXW83_09790 [Bosea sp. PAMC 26642]